MPGAAVGAHSVAVSFLRRHPMFSKLATSGRILVSTFRVNWFNIQKMKKYIDDLIHPHVKCANMFSENVVYIHWCGCELDCYV